MCTDERYQLMQQGHLESTSFYGLWEVRRHARATERYVCLLYHTTYRLGFPSLTEVEAVLSQGTLPLPHSNATSIYYLAVRLSPPLPLPNFALDMHSGRSRSQHCFLLSPLSDPSFGGPDNQAAVPVKGREKEEEKILPRKKRKEEKKEETKTASTMLPGEQ